MSCDLIQMKYNVKFLKLQDKLTIINAKRFMLFCMLQSPAKVLLTLLHLERPKLYTILACLSAKGFTFLKAPETEIAEL